MRHSRLLLVVAIHGLALGSAAANPTVEGGGGGGGPLGQVSAGIRGASGGGGSGGGSSGGSTTTSDEYTRTHWHSDWGPGYTGSYVGAYAAPSGPAVLPAPGPARLRFYAGAEQVHDSTGAVSLELALEDGWFRVGGSVTRYFERQPGDSMLTMTMPALTAGLRLPSDAATRVYVEAGVVATWTNNDPVADSRIKGGLVGVRLERRMTPALTFVGDAQAMFFEHDIRANAARVGLRFGHFQASLRVLDFDVGPPLYGPELGIAF